MAENQLDRLAPVEPAVDAAGEAGSGYVDDSVKKEYEKYYRTDNPLSDVHLSKYSAMI